MNCSEYLLEAWLDDELDAPERAAVESHVEGCPACAAAYARLRAQRAHIQAEAHYHRAPAGLRESIQGALRQADAPVRETRWRALAIAASLLLAASAGWNVLQLRPRAEEARAAAALAGSVLDDHLRSLAAASLVDVPSSDRHTVKPWFAGKLDFSPEVKDLAADGFPLVGGRIDYLAGRRVAALVYRRRQHVVNLFTWPAAPADGGEKKAERDGYNLLHWTSGNMTYLAVSDVAPEELQKLRELYAR